MKPTQQVSFGPSRQRGFTLVEMMIVIAVTGILALLSYFGARALLPGYRLNGAVRMVRGDLYNAKMLAAKRNRQYRALFSANGYQLQEGDAASGSTVWTTEVQRDFSDYADVTIKMSATVDPVFSPRGTSSNVTITLQNAGGDERTITTSIAGRIKVE